MTNYRTTLGLTLRSLEQVNTTLSCFSSYITRCSCRPPSMSLGSRDSSESKNICRAIEEPLLFAIFIFPPRKSISPNFVLFCSFVGLKIICSALQFSSEYFFDNISVVKIFHALVEYFGFILLQNE